MLNSVNQCVQNFKSLYFDIVRNITISDIVITLARILFNRSSFPVTTSNQMNLKRFKTWDIVHRWIVFFLAKYCAYAGFSIGTRYYFILDIR